MKKGCNGFQLKMAAIAAMLLDHFAAVVLERYLTSVGVEHIVFDLGNTNVPYWELTAVYMLLRAIGRIAFPIFCFFIVEGFIYTSNRFRYAGRLFAFALISEVPFDLAFGNRWIDASYQNVFFTLLLGLLTIWAIEALEKKTDEGKPSEGSASKKNLLTVICAAAGGLAAALLQTDYGMIGVIVIVIMYRMRKVSVKRGVFFSCLILMLSSSLEFTAFFDVWLLGNYNGTRGRQMKYFFYLFYPVHILLLYLICRRMGI